jgi:hypothetical protein
LFLEETDPIMLNLSVDSFPHTDEQFAEEMRNCTQSPADMVLVNVECAANVVKVVKSNFAGSQMEDYQMEKPVMRGALNYTVTNEAFKGKLIHSIAMEMEDKLLAEKQWSCVMCCFSGRSTAVRTSLLIRGLNANLSSLSRSSHSAPTNFAAFTLGITLLKPCMPRR